MIPVFIVSLGTAAGNTAVSVIVGNVPDSGCINLFSKRKKRPAVFTKKHAAEPAVKVDP